VFRGGHAESFGEVRSRPAYLPPTILTGAAHDVNTRVEAGFDYSWSSRDTTRRIKQNVKGPAGLLEVPGARTTRRRHFRDNGQPT
jgi:hypothetical protein